LSVILAVRRRQPRRSAAAIVVLSVTLVCACSQEQRLTVTATAFNSTPAQTDRHPLETACGERLHPGSRIVAVSRDLMERGLVCGTEIRISGVEGTWTVGDLTARRHKHRVDLYMGRDVKAARQWGVQEVEIKWRSQPRLRLADAER
jgi:3D (Asp-Asp-Asp) domain-containing protein